MIPLGYKIGDRVALVYTDDPHTNLNPGDTGTVNGGNTDLNNPHFSQIWVKWDNGSSLSMLPGVDRIKGVE